MREVERDEVPPWERPGAVRRDWEADRNWLLRRLERASLARGARSVCFVLPALVGLPLGVTTWVLAQRDLTKMQAGNMDPTGAEQTRLARGYSVEGVLLCIGSWAIWGLVFLVMAA